MTDHRIEELQARVNNSAPNAVQARDIIATTLGIGARFKKRRTEIDQDRNFSPEGRRNAIGEAAKGFLKDVVRAGKPIRTAKAHFEAQRAAMVPKGADKSDAAGAIREMEIRTYFRSLPPNDRRQLAFTLTDLPTIAALLSGPAMLSGLDDQTREHVLEKYVDAHFGSDLDGIKAGAEANDEADAAYRIAVMEIARDSGLSDHEARAVITAAEAE